MNITPTLSSADFERNRPHILAKLRQHSATLQGPGGERLAAAIVRRIFVELYGAARTDQERRNFFAFMAPIFRQLTLARMPTVTVGATARLGVVDMEEWLARLEGFDPQAVQMIDLHYFVGLSVRRTATMLGVSSQTVIRDLRFAKAWLQARARWLPGSPTST